jgi:peptidyl-prolyl cis-trans isomerase A (cyclophilin A)
MRHIAIAAALASSFVFVGDSRADLVAPPTPPAQELSAADTTKLMGFFEKLIPLMLANKDDCPKMAKAVDGLVTQNAAMLRTTMKQLTSGKALPADAEKRLTALMSKDSQSLMQCLSDQSVVNAMKRIEDPDFKPPPPPASYPEVKAPVAADLETYTKTIAGKGDLIATIKTNQGTVRCQLFGDKAPMTVANFVGLATGKKPWIHPKTQKLMKNKPYYDGLIFHRVIPEFMIQGGDPTGTGTSGPGYKFGDETSATDKMAPGTLAMANAGPATNGSQFFITEAAPDHLNGKHTIFGTCAPLDIVKKIARAKKDGTTDRPKPEVKMKVTISRGTL